MHTNTTDGPHDAPYTKGGQPNLLEWAMGSAYPELRAELERRRAEECPATFNVEPPTAYLDCRRPRGHDGLHIDSELDLGWTAI